ncbi:hypothetical protein GCM10008942_23750 [Rhizomicrobium electricum]|uniref:Uncharacterized protein n=1 Tax=Rhizomicrobium electricum TaxID=480070 RepID=A0ABP3PSF8_9PROT
MIKAAVAAEQAGAVDQIDRQIGIGKFARDQGRVVHAQGRRDRGHKPGILDPEKGSGIGRHQQADVDTEAAEGYRKGTGNVGEASGFGQRISFCRRK